MTTDTAESPKAFQSFPCKCAVSSHHYHIKTRWLTSFRFFFIDIIKHILIGSS